MCKLLTMEEVVTIRTAYNAGANRTPLRFSRTGIGGSTPVTSVNIAVGVSGTSSVCTSPPPCYPPSVLWNNNIGNIRKTNTPNLRETTKLNAHIDRSLTSDPIALSVRSQIFGDELSNISSRGLY